VTTDPRAVVEQTLRDLDVQHERIDADKFAVALPGEKRLKTACWLVVGHHALEVQAFVMRSPEENREQVFEFLLQRNQRMYGVAWALDSMGDVYLAGHLPLAAVTPDELDRLLGAVLEYADGTFNALLELGFGASIKREWAWRVKRGESLANLAAFRHLAERGGQQGAERADQPG
jgi:hypothetical protein